MVRNSKLTFNSTEAHAFAYKGVRVYIEACASMVAPTPSDKSQQTTDIQIKLSNLKQVPNQHAATEGKLIA